MIRTYRGLLKTVCITLACCSWSFSEQEPLIGVWTGIDSSGEIASLVFEADGSASYIEDEKIVFDPKTIGASLIWKLDRTKDPMHLDLIGTKVSGETITFPMIVRFVDETKILVKMPTDLNARPVNFSESDDGNQMVLHKE